MQFEHQSCTLNGVGKWKTGSRSQNESEEERQREGNNHTPMFNERSSERARERERETLNAMDNMAMKNSEIQFLVNCIRIFEH